MSFLGDALIVCGVAMDLVGADKSAVGEDDAIATHAQLLAEKRAGSLPSPSGSSSTSQAS